MMADQNCASMMKMHGTDQVLSAPPDGDAGRGGRVISPLTVSLRIAHTGLERASRRRVRIR